MNTKLYLLVQHDDDVDWDCMQGIVVRAKSAREARKLAASVAGDEGSAVWLSPVASRCRRILSDGKPAIILRDFNNG